jgi:transposase
MKKLLEKRFEMITVDEFKTSKTCNVCLGQLKRYRKKDGKLSYSRLCCENECAGRQKKDRSKHFVDRDLNAATNILLIGTSSQRPEAMRRSLKRSMQEDLQTNIGPKMNKLSVDAEGTSNDPAAPSGAVPLCSCGTSVVNDSDVRL